MPGAQGSVQREISFALAKYAVGQGTVLIRLFLKACNLFSRWQMSSVHATVIFSKHVYGVVLYGGVQVAEQRDCNVLATSRAFLILMTSPVVQCMS